MRTDARASRASTGQAGQGTKFSLTVDKDTDIRRQLARDDPGASRTVSGGVKVHPAGHVAGLDHIAPDRGIFDLTPPLA
jgi:hypothetical protein